MSVERMIEELRELEARADRYKRRCEEQERTIHLGAQRVSEKNVEIGRLERELRQAREAITRVPIVRPEVVSDVGTAVVRVRLHVTGEPTKEKVLFLGDTWGVKSTLEGDANGVHFTQEKTVTFELVKPPEFRIVESYDPPGLQMKRGREFVAHWTHRHGPKYGYRWDLVLWNGVEVQIVEGTAGYAQWNAPSRDRAVENINGHMADVGEPEFRCVAQVKMASKEVEQIEYVD